MLEFLKSIMASNIAQTLIIAAITALLGKYLQAKGKLVWGVSHQHFYNIPKIDGDGAFPVRTQQIWLQNMGRKAIEDIEFVLNWKPQHLEVWDPRHYVQAILPDGRYSLRFPNLSSKEAFTISILDTFQELPIVVSVRWKDGLGKRVNMGPQQIFPRWVYLALWALILAGVTAICFLVLQTVLNFFSVLKP